MSQKNTYLDRRKKKKTDKGGGGPYSGGIDNETKLEL